LEGGIMSDAELPLGMSREDVIQGLRHTVRLAEDAQRLVDPDFVRWPDLDTMIDHIEVYGFPPRPAPGVNPLDDPKYPGLCTHAERLLVSRFYLLEVLRGDRKDPRIEAYLAKHNLWGHS
jgi:hypothetical protein